MDHNTSTPKQTPASLLADTYHDSAHYEVQLGLCHGYFRVLRTRRQGPAFLRVGRAVRYGERAVAAWLEQQQARPAGGAA